MEEKSSISKGKGENQAGASRFIKGTNQLKPSNVDGAGVMAMFVHPLCILLVCVPLGAWSNFSGWGAVPTFWFNFLGLVPLAKILGDATEELAAGLRNDMLAGLLNATFGNAVEVVITIMTLRAGLIDVVKATLLGSVLSNLLLVLGCSFFFGGIMAHVTTKRDELTKKAPGASKGGDESAGRSSASSAQPIKTTSANSMSEMEFAAEKVQTFSVLSAMVNTSLLLLSCLSLSLVTVFYLDLERDDMKDRGDVIIEVSRTCAIAMMLSYLAYVFFQLVTHREAMQEEEGEGDEEDGPTMSIFAAVSVMFLCTVIVSLCSEMMVDCLEEVVDQLHMSSHFIGIILLPIVGNACEHVSAIRFAIQDKPGLSIGIAVGSSTQISLFVVPFSVLAGWAINQPMDLNFGSLNTTVLSLSVIVVLSIVVDGAATWLQGYLLVSAYLLIGVLYWHLPDKMREVM
jgi:Ca2+:H+ antiporter